MKKRLNGKKKLADDSKSPVFGAVTSQVHVAQ